MNALALDFPVRDLVAVPAIWSSLALADGMAQVSQVLYDFYLKIDIDWMEQTQVAAFSGMDVTQ